MKNCKFLPLIISIIFTCLSCSRNTDEYNAPVFKKNIKVTLETLNDNFSFTYGSIDCIDTLVIISNETPLNNNTFHLFSANSGKYIMSFGASGRGPGETLFPSPAFSVDYWNKEIYVYDTPQQKIIRYSLPNVINGNHFYYSEMKIPVDAGKIMMQKFFFLKKNKYLWALNRFILGNSSGIISVYDSYPRLNEPEEYKKLERSYFNQMGNLGVSPDKSKFVHVTTNGCIMETFSCGNDTIKPLSINRLFKPEYTCSNKTPNYPILSPTAEAICGIRRVACTDNYIYANYSDVPQETSNKIYAVFDWDCKPIRTLSFNDKISRMTILPGDKVGFALAEREDGTVYLARFEL